MEVQEVPVVMFEYNIPKPTEGDRPVRPIPASAEVESIHECGRNEGRNPILNARLIALVLVASREFHQTLQVSSVRKLKRNDSCDSWHSVTHTTISISSSSRLVLFCFAARIVVSPLVQRRSICLRFIHEFCPHLSHSVSRSMISSHCRRFLVVATSIPFQLH